MGGLETMSHILVVLYDPSAGVVATLGVWAHLESLGLGEEG
jgi:hypothetical protein